MTKGTGRDEQSARSEVDLQASPFEGLKLARVVVTDGTLAFAPLFERPDANATYLADDWARCDLQRDHPAPDRDCSCGFHAVRTDDELSRLGNERPGVYVLEVSLAGHVIEHEHGYRAAFQSVDTLRVSSSCYRCGLPTRGLSKAGRRVVPTCVRHSRRGWSLDRVGTLLGCAVRIVADGGRAGRDIRAGAHLRAVAAPATAVVGASPFVLTAHSGMPLTVAAITAMGLAPMTDEWVRRYLDRHEMDHQERRRLHGATRRVATMAGVIGMWVAVMCAVGAAPSV